MKTIMKIVGVLFVLIVVLFVLANIDSGKNSDDYTLEDLPPAAGS